MKLGLLLVACQTALSLRPDGIQDTLDLEDVPGAGPRSTDPVCVAITPSELCKTELKDEQCFILRGPALPKSLTRCRLQGPLEGYATLHANSTEGSRRGVFNLGASKAKVTVRGGLIFHGIRLEFEGLRFRGARLQMYDTIVEEMGTGSRTRHRDGGAIWAGKRGLKIAESQIYINSSYAKTGGAIFVNARGQLLLSNHSTLVTQNTRAMLSGGSISTRNFRIENRSTLELKKSFGKNGGAVQADLFVIRKGSRVQIAHAQSANFGGAVSSFRRFVVQYDSEVNISNCSAELNSGGGIYAGSMEVRNASIEVQHGAVTGTQGPGGCLFVANTIMLRGGSVRLSHCEAINAAGMRAGNLVWLRNSSKLEILYSAAKSSAGSLMAQKVRIEDSLLRVAHSRSVVPPAAMLIGFELSMTGGEVEVSDTDRNTAFAAVVLGSGAYFEHADDMAEIRMTQGSRLTIRAAYAGIFGGKNSSFQLRNCLFEDLNDTAVDTPEGRYLGVEDSVVQNIGGSAFTCIECDALEMARISARHISNFVRASGLLTLALRNLEVYCSSRGCITVGGAPAAVSPKPWLLEDLDVHLEHVNGAEKPMLLDLQAIEVNGSVTRLNATCPAGSFSLVQQTFGTVVKMFKGNLLMAQGVEGSTCCMSTADIPPTFLNANRDVPFVLLPNLTEPCAPQESACLCTDGRCKGQMRKSQVAYLRISCLDCPVGQYSLSSVTRQLAGGETGLFDSPTLVESRHNECISCDNVEVDKKPLCQGRSVVVPRGIMASHIGLQPNSSCSERRLCFYRCPNADACPGGEVVGVESACAPAYNDSYPGCSVCASGYGRKNTDPFECTKCGEWNLSAAYFLLLPLAPIILAVRSASQTEKERMSMMIKVILSFGTFVDSLHNILAETEIYQSMHQEFRVALGIVQGAGDSSTLVATSFDCLIRVEQVTRWHHLLLQLFHPVLLLAIFCLMEFGHWRTAFQASWCRRCIVLGNTFLPALFATFFQWSPCFHMQVRADQGFDSYAAYHIHENCPEPMAFSMPVAGSILFLIAGPIFWARLVTSSQKWDLETRKRYVGFLVAGYQEKCEWWEIAVLLRKALLTAATVFLPVDYAPLSLVIATSLVMLAALVGHLSMKPYADEFMNVLEGGILTYCMAALMVTLYLGSRSWSSTSKPSVFAALVVSMAITSIVLLLAFVVTALPKASARREAERPPAG